MRDCALGAMSPNPKNWLQLRPVFKVNAVNDRFRNRECEKGGMGGRKGKRKRRTWVMSEQSEVSRIKMLRRMGAAEGDATVEGIERACGVPVEECSDRGVT